ncbi:MAG: serine/threonine-protein kinase, partial [Acidobacteria bacterium]|nr:serine/threonine-protein kinase [Acidobacteriota bacterium]
MILKSGTRLRNYEVIQFIGAGGMGEVYRARDLKLKRDVAIKVLPDAFSCDADRLARFQREAQVLASLNHPGIAGIHELGELDDSRFLVLELVEGETLAERLQREKIPVAEALRLAGQIAEALEAAHAKGIVHCDLKPANIKLTPEGKVKVLDFGLAKIREVTGVDLSDAPTLSAEVPGSIVGTPAYMSPEQVTGKHADRLSDMWAFGCVLYEMLTAHQLFAAKTTTEVLAGVLKSAPQWDRLPPETPEEIRRLLRRCLQKDRNDRQRDIGDARIEIADAQSSPETRGDRRETMVPVPRRPMFLVAIILLIAGTAAYWILRPSPQLTEMRLEITTPPTAAPQSFAISPDGSTIAFVANNDGRPQLWLRPLTADAASPVPGTDFSSGLFWSPDSRFVGFTMDNKIHSVDIHGGVPRPLASTILAGGSWNQEGIIFFTGNSGGISSVSSRGGEVTAVTHIVGKQPAHFFPSFLPDGNHFLYYVPAGDEPNGVYLDHIKNSAPRRLLDADGVAVYYSGYLLFPQQGTLFAQEFDAGRLELSGDAFPVAQGLSTSGTTDVPNISVSADGKIVYRKATAGNAQRQFAWFDRNGNELQEVGPLVDSFAGSLSARGRQLAFSQLNAGNYDVFLLDIERGTVDRFTTDPATDAMPVFSPDRTQIAFTSSRKGAWGLYRSSINTPGIAEVLLLEEGKVHVPTDWSRDGRYLLYRTPQPGKWDIWVLPLDHGIGQPRPVIQTDAEERDA